MSLSPSARKVVKHLAKFGSISNVEAHAILKVRSLSRRITEISERTSIDISKEMKKDSEGQRYMRYSLSEYEQQFVRNCFPAYCE
jgi:hypothetical protein